MIKKELPIIHLQDFLPPETYDPVLGYLDQYHVHLTVARERKTILGDYRHSFQGKNHRISVNGNLNKYAFLITLLHELAHMLTFEKFGNRVLAHGREWKYLFAQLLQQFIERDVFPSDIKQDLLLSIQNPAASSCADERLFRTLRNYDSGNTHLVLLELMAEGALFKTHDGKIFRRGHKIRKRFQCEEIKTKKIYLFSPLYEAEVVK